MMAGQGVPAFQTKTPPNEWLQCSLKVHAVRPLRELATPLPTFSRENFDYVERHHPEARIVFFTQGIL